MAETVVEKTNKSEDKFNKSGDKLSPEEERIATDLILHVFKHHPPPPEHCKLATVLGTWVHEKQDEDPKFVYEDESKRFEKARLEIAFRKQLCAQAKEARNGTIKPLRWNDVNKLIQVNEMRLPHETRQGEGQDEKPRVEDASSVVSTAPPSRVSSTATSEPDPEPVSSERKAQGSADIAYPEEPKVQMVDGKGPVMPGRQPAFLAPPGLEPPNMLKDFGKSKGKNKIKAKLAPQEPMYIKDTNIETCPDMDKWKGMVVKNTFLSCEPEVTSRYERRVKSAPTPSTPSMLGTTGEAPAYYQPNYSMSPYAETYPPMSYYWPSFLSQEMGLDAQGVDESFTGI